MSYIYLAAPYNSSNENKRYERYLKVVEVAAMFLRKGVHSYSPIIIQHSLLSRHSLPSNDTFWLPLHHKFLLHATSLGIIKLPEWEKSNELHVNIIFATKHNIPIKYIEYPLV